jgi:hypothetical protein
MVSSNIAIQFPSPEDASRLYPGLCFLREFGSGYTKPREARNLLTCPQELNAFDADPKYNNFVNPNLHGLKDWTLGLKEWSCL